MSVGFNSTEGISNGAAVTAANSGPPSGDAWSADPTIGASGAVVSDNAHAAHGSQAHKFTTGASASNCFVSKTVTAKPTYFVRSSPFTWSSLTLNPTLGRLRSTGGTVDVGRVRVSSAGKLQILDTGPSVVATGTTTLTTGTQYRIEYFFTQGASSTAEVKLFTGVNDALGTEVETLTVTAQNFGTADIDTIQFGQVASVSNLPALWLDDMAWSHIGYMGPAELITPPPTKTWMYATDRREVPQQRAYVSDPSLLSTALLDELLGSGDTARHQYAAEYVSRRLVPQQRNYVSVPGMLATALLENELLGDAQHRTAQYAMAATESSRRLVPQQRNYISPPGLLNTALLENELLGGADTAKRYATPATHAPRWWMPRQPKRDGFTPGLLNSAQLEGPLLAGDVKRQYGIADFWDRREMPQQRPYISDPSFYPTTLATDPLTLAWGTGGHYWSLYNQAALVVDRREVPQQRQLESPPGLLNTAELENELLGGAETEKRTYVPVTHAPRWWPPQQPLRDAQTPGLLDDALLEPPLLGGDVSRHRAAADYYWDRREVPQQRPYISDPSFYPIPGVTDPTTLAWGAGGRYWLTYNQAATHVDRRLSPQQRQLESDPNLLNTAQLEPPLLGGDVRRHYAAADYWRSTAPQQRAYLSVPQLDDMLGNAETLRRILTAATHGSRRQTVPQRLYVSDPAFYPVPIAADPNLVAWGAGGKLWSIYNTAALYVSRRLAGQQRNYFIPGEDCETFPPFTGTTPDDLVLTGRPSTGATSPLAGSTARPFNGTTLDPC